MVATTPTWLVLIAALGGGIVGSLISGALLILNNHIQAKRDNSRRRDDFERQTRVESLDRVKVAIDQGINLSTFFMIPNRDDDDGPGLIRSYGEAINGARIASLAIGFTSLSDTIQEVASLMSDISKAIENDEPTRPLILKVIAILGSLEKQYIEVKSQF